jgi:integrase/recombinase XerC
MPWEFPGNRRVLSVARIARPWFWEERNGWYVNKDGQRRFLGEHPADAPPPRKTKKNWNAPRAILQAFHTLMAAPQQSPRVEPKSLVELTVVEVLDRFLEWCKKHRAPRTYDGHKDRIQLFLKESNGIGKLPASELRPFHVVEWVDKHATWGNTRKRMGIMSIQRPYNWAEELGYIEVNPVKKIKKPPCGRREQAVTPEQWATIRDHYRPHDPFRDFLEYCWETGCRPFEARMMEVRHVRLERSCVLFPPDEAKGKKRWRIIRLTPVAVEILRRRINSRTQGVVFLNANGNPWTAFAMNCRFCRLKKHTGVKHFAYALRHGFATRKLIEGHDHLTVAELLGHKDGSTLAKVYAHLDQADEHLRKALA